LRGIRENYRVSAKHHQPFSKPFPPDRSAKHGCERWQGFARISGLNGGIYKNN
jgi:hypothetical protein